jgi:NCAIR mutase (PurE)-related protein
VVWGPGKTPLQIATIMRKLAEQDQLAVASRIEPGVTHASHE